MLSSPDYTGLCFWGCAKILCKGIRMRASAIFYKCDLPRAVRIRRYTHIRIRAHARTHPDPNPFHLTPNNLYCMSQHVLQS